MFKHLLIPVGYRVGALAIVFLVATSVSSAQTQQPTEEQLRMLRSLPPAQRAELLKRLEAEQASAVAPAPKAPVPSMELTDRLTTVPAPELLEQEQLVPRIGPGSTIVVEFLLPEPLLEDDLAHPRLATLIGRHVVELDHYGVLEMQGIYKMPLAGLSAEEAAKRIASEPDFRTFEVEVTILPLEPTGTEALQLFGQELFEGVPTTFAPATDIPVPSDYIVGPGDTLLIQLFGNVNAQYELPVNRDGQVQFPGIGPVTVAGISFDAVRADLNQRIAQQMIGVSASITMGMLRSIRVFVMGDARHPGSYTVSGLSTITNALFASGGVQTNGSLRDISLRRDGALIGRLDLYDLLLRGDTRGDQRLQPGDVILVPPIGSTVGVEGEVIRPALYELRGERTVGELLALAGGLRPSALPRAAQLERITDAGERTVLDIDLGTEGALQTRVRNGDVLRVYSVLDETVGTVSLTGHVHQPRQRQWFRGMRLTDLIPTPEVLRPRADLNYLLVRRELPPDRRVRAFSVDLREALAAPRSPADPVLESRDRVIVFALAGDRSAVVEPLLAELTAQARDGVPVLEVSVGGRVTAAGRYPLESGMRVSDLIRAGGMLDEAAYTLEAELTRYEVVDGQYRATRLVGIDLQRVLAGDREADLFLQPHDYLNVKEIPQWRELEQIEVLGEVRFPGFYNIHRGETLSSVLERAGGLTDLAFPEGSVFVREDLKEREQQQIEQLATRLESDLAQFSLQATQQDGNAAQVLPLAQSLLGQLRATEAAGRLVIDIERLMGAQGDPYQDIVLKNGDRLFIPERTQEVTVLGEVQYATSHIFEPGLKRDDYIKRSGGVTQKADSKRIYVVRANGEVFTSERSVWFKESFAANIRPGDTIVVPIDADRMAPLARWTAVSQIIYQLALAAASANAVGVF